MKLYFVPLTAGHTGPCHTCPATIRKGDAYWFGDRGWVCNACKVATEAEAEQEATEAA